MRRYGGVQNAVLINEVREAECVVLPEPPHHSIWELLLYLPIIIIKLLPITLLLMAVMWGVAFLITGTV